MYGIIDYEWFIIKKIEKRGEYLKIVVVKLWQKNWNIEKNTLELEFMKL